MKAALRWANLALASGLFLSYLPAWLLRSKRYTGAGLVGSAWGIALICWLPADPWRQIAVWAGALAISIVVGDAAEEALGTTDDPRIVIDEFIGMWTALLFLPSSLPVLVLAFILFRVFDVTKPGWIHRASKLPGGWGVVLDDVLAGVATNVLLQLVQYVHPL